MLLVKKSYAFRWLPGQLPEPLETLDGSLLRPPTLARPGTAGSVQRRSDRVPSQPPSQEVELARVCQ